MASLTRREWALLTFILIYSFIPTFGGLLRVAELAGGLSVIPENLRASLQPLPILLHILGSFVFCLFGALQFLPTLRANHPGLHRAAGRWIVFSGLISAATGLWMTLVFVFPPELQGPLLYTARLIFSLAMMALIVWAVVAIRTRNVPSHSAAMLRAYAIAQGASTQTVFGITWMVVFGADATGLARDAMMVLAWLVNIAVAEALIYRSSMSVPRLISIRSNRSR
ncbi:DUF2306 domain-containing protein [Litoreibacter ponti]|nr:DUF2306 domain-containing protein [Litoreibacter ponti]